MTKSTKSDAPEYGTYNITNEMREEFTYQLVSEAFKKKFANFKWTHPEDTGLAKLLDDSLTQTFPELLGPDADPSFVSLYGAKFRGWGDAGFGCYGEHVASRVYNKALNSAFPHSYKKRDTHPFYSKMETMERAVCHDVGQPLAGDRASKIKVLPYGVMTWDRWSSEGELKLFESKKQLIKNDEGEVVDTLYTIDFIEDAKKLFPPNVREEARKILVTSSAEHAKFNNIRAEMVNTAAMVWDAVKFYRSTKQLKDGWPQVYEKFMVINQIAKPKSTAVRVCPVDLDAVNKSLEV